MIKLGSFVSFKKPNYLVGAAQESINNGANTMMIYLGAPQTTARADVALYQLEEFEKEYQSKIAKDDIVVHAPYIINPANPEKSAYSIDFLVKEIKRMNYIGARLLVLHPGAYTKYDPEDALDTLVDSLKTILEQTEDVIICIETMAGKGTEIGINFEQISYLLKWVNSDRLKVCLDTCHMWDAGYNLKEYNKFKEELKKWDLLKEVKVIHLNDSKNDLNSHKDRHANIDQGFIGLKTLQRFVHDPDFDNIPIILETPFEGTQSPYKEEIKMLLNKE
ncbi:deoxyribonuclease IV [Mycoplasmopsis glycophila]|uniref:Probable endonuclease 4 n=1 Tax=Mycoplasmopsis glycophila TaxID=171285 RepID=A0A449AUR4_9BACT|nr:deoxyribonuclease IV [Mycoplasmopsis glycophila]VEU70251.1 putative endonuclease 4 [Mycoplasmopsis glycophila]